MKNLQKYISHDGVQQVEQALMDAEKKTSCEIVAVIYDKSDSYYWVNFLFGFFFSLVCLCLIWFLFPPTQLESIVWISESQWRYLALLIGVMIIGFGLGVLICDKINSLKLMFLSNNQLRKQVEHKCRWAFCKYHVGQTQKKTGIIVAISMFEHVVHIHADEAVNAHFNQSDWEQVRDVIIQGIKKRNLSKGLSDGIARLGDILKVPLPVQDQDVNELSNRLNFIEFGVND